MTEVPPMLASDLSALPALLTVAEVAEVLRVGRSWVYEHAAELGAVKLGTGQTAPLRIPRDGVRRIVGMPSPRRERRAAPARQARETLGGQRPSRSADPGQGSAQRRSSERASAQP